LENKKLSNKYKELEEQNKVLKEKTKEEFAEPSPGQARKGRSSTDIIEEEKQGHVPYSGENDYVAEDWWKSNFRGSVSMEEFVPLLLKSFPDSLSREDRKIAEGGVKDYFRNTTKNNRVTYQHLEHFLRLYGPIEGMQHRVASTYKQSYFHGFISYEEAANSLKGQVGSYLVRYSQSLLDKGCFVLNVNRGQKKGSKNTAELIENYVVLWHAQQEYFSFYKKTYNSLQSFVEDPMYAKILVDGVDNANKYKF